MQTVRDAFVGGLLWFSALGCGVMAGVYFAFSTFIMAALGRIDHAAGMSAIAAINLDIVRSPFMPLFFGTTLSSAALTVLALLRWGDAGEVAMLAAGVAYVGGMFAVTVACNVPLNDALAAADSGAAEGASLWTKYLSDWTFWNHIRTVACITATALFTAAIATR